jgi:Sensors of blue-light using FAD
MTQLFALAYFSSAKTEFSEAELESLLQTAREENSRGQLTGVLLYYDGTFFQYIEGPEEELNIARQRIWESRRHHGIIQLFHRSIPQREFDGWRMGFARAPKSLILQLSNAEWQEIALTNLPSIKSSPGMALLLEFWKSCSR